MHISEGYLPIAHALAWTTAAAPAVAWSYRSLDLRELPRERRLLMAASAGFLFALTALKLPSVAGSSSHPAGIALSVILLGPRAVPVLAFIVLLFQALLLAHGGLTTLGANVVSLGVMGPLATWVIWKAALALGISEAPAVIAAAAAGSLGVYVTAAAQLALAFPDPAGGVAASFARFGAIFAVTQAPVALAEGLFTMLLLRTLQASGRKAVAL